MIRRMTRGFDSLAWVDRMPGFPSSGTVIQGTVIGPDDPDVSDFPRISDFPDSSGNPDDAEDEPQPPGGTFPS